MIKKNQRRVLLSIIGMAVLVVTITGVSFAFFNYTRTGNANTVRTGRIYFNAPQGESINLTNAFPVKSARAQTDTTNVKTLSITVTGDTDYSGGLEYLVTAEDVNMETVGGRSVPLKIEVSVADIGEAPNNTSLGTAETGDYFANRASYMSSGNTPGVNKYKILYDGTSTLSSGDRILVGYIAENATYGTPGGVNGVINFRVYIDGDRVAITDTLQGTEPNNANYTYGTTSTWVDGREVFTTDEWNYLQTHPLTFKIKVEANEGQWVEEPPPLATTVINNVQGLVEIAGAKRYVGANPNNYVEFNNGELWRIVGVYGDNLKIVRSSPLDTKKAWQNTYTPVWDGSILQQYLNQDTIGGYYYSLSENAKTMISEETWNVGTCNNNYIVAADVYTCAQGTTWSGKVGLLAGYEYLYAASETNNCWYTNFSDICVSLDWLKPTLDNNTSDTYWLINPQGTNSSVSLRSDNGKLTGSIANQEESFSPAVYLNSNVTIIRGTGTELDPYILR